MCAPNFKDWIESYGLECFPIGPDIRPFTGIPVQVKPVLPSPEQLQEMANQSVRDQFRVIGEAALGCDLIIAASALQIAARSIAEARRIPYMFATYTPAVLPSPTYPPPKTGGFHPHNLSASDNLQLWAENAAEFDLRFGAVLNSERVKLGLEPVTTVRDYMFTNRPWLAVDPLLAPAAPLAGIDVIQTGAWMLSDERELPSELDQFLANGLAPIYVGFGSTRIPEQTGQMLIEAAQSLGLRLILGNMNPDSHGDHCISIGSVNFGKLFPRVVAVVHHGGAGTTQAAALAGRPQLVIPHLYDQFYWAHRVQQLGLGTSVPARENLTIEVLIQALRDLQEPNILQNAQQLSRRMERHGARLAAQRLITELTN